MFKGPEQNSIEENIFQSEVDDKIKKVDEKQILRERRYKLSVEKESSLEIRETIDIFNRPLLLRRANDIESFLEMERKGKIVAPGVTKRQLMKNEKAGINAWFDSDSISMSMAIPWNISKEKEAVTTLTEINPDLDRDAIQSLIEEAHQLALLAYITEEDDSQKGVPKSKTNKERTERVIEVIKKDNFIDRVLADKKKLDVWITMQKLWFTADEKTLASLGETGYAAVDKGARKSTFLIDPRGLDGLVVDPVGSADYSFEIWGLKSIPVQKILGFIENDLNRYQMENLDYFAGNLYPEESQFKAINSVVKNLLNLIAGEGLVSWRENTEEEKEGWIVNICNLLNIDRSEFDPNTVEELIEMTPGVFQRFYINQPSKGKVPNMPDIDTANLSIQEIRSEIFQRREEALKSLFPGVDFKKEEDVIQSISIGLKQYIRDRFKVDIEGLTQKDLIEMIVKKMGIPIYNLDGDQLWPDKKTHSEIVKELEGKNS